MFGTRRQFRVYGGDLSWLRPIDPWRFTTVRFAPSAKRAGEVAGPDVASSRAARMAQHPAAQSRRQACPAEVWSNSESTPSLSVDRYPETVAGI